MSVQITFVSVDNKRLLWDLLLKNNIFSDIPIQKEGLVKKIFEDNISTTETLLSKTAHKNVLSDYNKQFISTIIPQLNNIKKKKSVSFGDESATANISKKEVYENLQDKDVLTAEKQQKIRQDQFSSTLEIKQKEFSSMINTNIPNKIDFSDSSKDDHITNMDEQLESIINSRNSDLKTLYKDNPPPAKTIQEKAMHDNTTNIENKSPKSDNKRLIIGEKVTIKDIILVSNTSHNTDGDYTLKETLDQLLHNQKIILERLETIKII